MKVIGFTTVVAGLAATVGGILYATGPGFRTCVNQHVHNWIGWTEAARQADPVGFTNQVEASLQQDLTTLQSTQGELNKEVSDLGREIRQHRALAEHAERLAAEFRHAFRQAKKNNGFPVIVRVGAYTAEQVETQVSLLLAEANGYRTSLAKLEKIRQQAEEKLEALAVRISTTQAQLAMLPTQRELLRARVLSDAGEQFVAQVEGLLEGNRQVVRGNPVRSVAELIAAPTEDVKPRSRLQAARDYLAADVDEAAPSPSDDVPVAGANRGK